jgi:ribosomal protein S18 acetylase RimI-like enzyme
MSLNIPSIEDLWITFFGTNVWLPNSRSCLLSSEAMKGLSELRLFPDEWLADILGRPVWRLAKGAGARPMAELFSADTGFAYAKRDVSDVKSISRLVDKGFRIVDTALTFDGSVALSLPSLYVIRTADVRDADAVIGIAGSAFRFSRFHLDPDFPLELANRIKSEWAGNFFSGQRGDGMVVAESDGQVAGFLQLIWGAEGVLIIDLIAVHSGFQGRGIATAMIVHASRFGTGDGRVPAGILVGTQAANIPSVRLYESLGLRLRSAQYVLHFHCSGTGTRA